MGRDVLFDFSAGGGSDLEFLIGDLTLEPTAMHEVGDRTVLPMPRTEGVNAGLLTLNDVATSPTGPNPLWAYKLTVRDTISKKAYSTIVGVPAGTGPITFKLLPKFQMPPNPGLGPTVQWLVEDFLAKSETITNAVSQAIAADPRIGQIEAKNNAQDLSLDLLLKTTQAIDAPAGFDANSVTKQAIHMVNGLDGAINMPGAGSWTLLTYPNAADGEALQQLALRYSTSGPQLWSRVKTSGGWSPWTRLDADKWAERLDVLDLKNTEQDGRLDELEEIQAIKSVRFEGGKWVWGLTGATHYVLIDHTGSPTVRATQWPQPSPTTPEFTW